MSNLRTLAIGQPCRLRIPFVCNRNDKTVVLCHIKRGHCGSTKPVDIIAVAGCSSCHDAIDGRQKVQYTRTEMDSMILRALCEQLDYYAEQEIVKW